MDLTFNCPTDFSKFIDLNNFAMNKHRQVESGLNQIEDNKLEDNEAVT